MLSLLRQYTINCDYVCQFVLPLWETCHSVLSCDRVTLHMSLVEMLIDDGDG
jgi:hypothetical protein